MSSPGAVLPSPVSAYNSVGQYRRLLTEGRADLRARYSTNPSAAQLLRQHTALVDRALRSVWNESPMPPELTLFAVGGYGRSQLFPHSDVDVLFLLPDEIDDDVREKVSELVGRLWDVGLEIGHSARSVEQCVLEAAHDVTVQTNLLEARFVAGDRSLARKFFSAVEAALDPRAFFEAKLLEQQLRHGRFNDTAYNLEPNVKEGPGGLRDLTNILWVSSANGMGRTWMDLARRHLITSEEARHLARHERTLQDLRIRLHYQANRREDRLLFDLQTPLANEVGLRDSPAKRASEQLMQIYYRTARAVTQLNEIILQNLRVSIFPAQTTPPIPLNERFQARNELLEIVDTELYERYPSAILETFRLLQDHAELKGIAASTLRALWRGARHIDAAFRRDPTNRAIFIDMFRHGIGLTHALRRMNRYDVLGRYLPPFGRIVGQMQHDLFHVYTVDEHILMVVRNLRRFAVTEMSHEYPLCSRLMSEFSQPEVLYLAGMFHDIAKGRGGDHSVLGMRDARRFCISHGLSAEDTPLVVWLVEHHLTMSSVAQKKDLSDPEVIADFARLVENDRRLTALYLLTVADIRGTSPKVWNAWKGKLLEDLFWSARRYLSGDTNPAGSRLQNRQRLALEKLKLYALPDGVHEKLWAQLDTPYFLRHDAREIAWHARLLNGRVDTKFAVVKARLSPIGEGAQVLIYAPDRGNLFARICSFFERIGFSIVEAKIYTTLHGYALDTFQVMDPAKATTHYRDVIAYIEHELSSQLEQQGPLPPPIKGRISRRVRSFPITPEVGLRPDEKGSAWYLSFIAGDRPGLLSSVARVLVSYGISVRTAKINTLGERAEDSFVITGDALRETKMVIRLESDLIRELQT
ncbi:MAG TPA: [protein-PII] uridylyltransferase [Steroidobacteraceae bacterium]|jgi:[protein-PII] uridylyltransferase|nr:[protein-PII] uridylyltransferase [Steroidobacteraceae bacterium]